MEGGDEIIFHLPSPSTATLPRGFDTWKNKNTTFVLSSHITFSSFVTRHLFALQEIFLMLLIAEVILTDLELPKKKKNFLAVWTVVGSRACFA